MFLAAILVDFVIKNDEKEYLQVFFEKIKYTEKEENMLRYITDGLKSSDDDCDEE